MKRKRWIWLLLAAVGILLLFVIFNWDAFAAGIEEGRKLAE